MQTAVYEQKQSRTTAINVLGLMFLVVFILFTYAFLHESGHALAGFVFGQKLTEFKIDFLHWDVYVGMVGNLTASQRAVQSLAGTVLPLLVWFVLISLAPRKMSFIPEMLKLIGSMVVLNTLLAWIFLPVLYFAGKAPPSDDVTRFLNYSQISPILLIFTALIVYVRGWSLFLSRIDGLLNEFRLFRAIDTEPLTPATGKTLAVTAVILTLGILFTFLLDRSGAGNQSIPISPPPDFASVAQIDLSNRAHFSDRLVELSLEETGYVGVFVIVQDINTSYFDLSVTGPDGFSSTVLHGEGYNTNQDGGLWEKNLSPGTYHVVLTSHQSPGTVSLYLQTP